MHQKNFYKEKRHAQEVLLSTIYERIMVTKGVVASVSDRGWQDHASIMRGKVLDGLNEAMDSLEELMTLTESSGGSPQDTTV